MAALRPEHRLRNYETLVHSLYEQGKGIICLLVVHQYTSGKTFETALAHAHAIGGTRGAVEETTFKEETETNVAGAINEWED